MVVVTFNVKNWIKLGFIKKLGDIWKVKSAESLWDTLVLHPGGAEAANLSWEELQSPRFFLPLTHADSVISCEAHDEEFTHQPEEAADTWLQVCSHTHKHTVMFTVRHLPPSMFLYLNGLEVIAFLLSAADNIRPSVYLHVSSNLIRSRVHGCIPFWAYLYFCKQRLVAECRLMTVTGEESGRNAVRPLCLSYSLILLTLFSRGRTNRPDAPVLCDWQLICVPARWISRTKTSTTASVWNREQREELIHSNPHSRLTAVLVRLAPHVGQIDR